jgi:hypothetical protein
MTSTIIIGGMLLCCVGFVVGGLVERWYCKADIKDANARSECLDLRLEWTRRELLGKCSELARTKKERDGWKAMLEIRDKHSLTRN